MKLINDLKQNILKYARVYWKLVKFAASFELEYRFSFLLEVFVEVAYFIALVFSFRVLYWNVQEIAGWSYYQLLILAGVNQIFSETLLGLAFIFNLRDLPDKIERGDLDLVLSKPINSQFAVSLWRPYFAMFPSILAGLITVIVAFNQGHIPFHILSLLPFALIFSCGLIIAYSIGMMLTTLSVWLINASPLPDLAQQILFLARNPNSAYANPWRLIFTAIVPLAFMVSFPAQILLGEFHWLWLVGAVVLAGVFLEASNLFWRFALKHYASASS
jgi:ABC-2 type transport system permease protein